MEEIKTNFGTHRLNTPEKEDELEIQSNFDSQQLSVSIHPLHLEILPLNPNQQNHSKLMKKQNPLQIQQTISTKLKQVKRIQQAQVINQTGGDTDNNSIDYNHVLPQQIFTDNLNKHAKINNIILGRKMNGSIDQKANVNLKNVEKKNHYKNNSHSNNFGQFKKSKGKHVKQLNDYAILPTLLNEHSQVQSQQSFQSKTGEVIGFENLEMEKNKCSLDNNQRLDKIINLHDLVNFKVKTVADKYFDYLKQPVKQSDQQEINHSFSILQQMYDPLLQASSFNQRSKVKNFINQKQKSSYNIKIKKQYSDYEIPEDLQKKQKNFNILNVVQQKELQTLHQQNTLKTSIDESSIDKDQIQNYHNLIKINTNMDLKSEIHNQISQQSQEEKLSIDPIQQLKNFFLYKKQEKKNQKDSSQKSNKKQKQSQDEKQEINLMDYSDQLNQDQGQNHQQIQKKDYKLNAVHENYIISKYQKMRKSGQLDKQMKLQSEELKNLENIQIQIAQNQIHKIYQEVLKKNSNIDDEIINYPIKKKVKTGPHQTSQQFHRPVKVINKPQSMQYNRKNVHNIEVPAIMQDFNQQYEAEDPQNIQTQSQQTQFRDHKNQYSNQEQKSIETFQNAHRFLKDVLNESRDEGTAQAISLKYSQESSLSNRNNQISNSFNKNPFLLEDNQAQIIYSQIFDKNLNQEKNKSSQDEILFENIRKHKTLIEDIIGQRSSSQMVINKDDEYGLRQENQKNELTKEKQNLLNGYSFSELMKIQSVKSHISNRMYINFSEQQIQLAQKLKDFEINKYKSQKQKTKSLEYNNEFAKNQELKIKKNQTSSQEYSDSNTNKLNIHGSLPNLRMQLESRKTSKPLTSKIYQEDKLEEFNNEQQYEF